MWKQAVKGQSCLHSSRLPAGTRFGNVKKVLIISRTWKLGQSCLHSSPLPAGTDKLTMMNRVISKENHNDKIKTTEAPKSLN